MDQKSVRVLLIEDSPLDAQIICRVLDDGGSYRFEVARAERLGDGLERLSQGGFDVLLLDLTLPDSRGYATFEAAFAVAGEVPILILTGLDDEALAVRAVRAGAQDYLPKDSLRSGLLPRALRHAIERKEVECELRQALRARLQAEEALRESAMRLRLVIEQMPAVLWTTDLGLRITSVQGAELAKVDLRLEEVVGKGVLDIFPAGAGLPSLEAHQRAVQGESVRFEERWRGRVFEAHVEPLRGAGGEIVGCIGAAVDATERKQAEERMWTLAETLEALVEASPLAIVTFDEEHQVTLWSPAAERTFGWKAEEVLGKRLPLVPEDKLDEHLSLCDSVLTGRRFTGVETRRLDSSGSPLELRISAAPLRDAQGRIRGIAEFLEDINDRKRAERAIRRLASLPEQSPDPLIELDLAGSALYVNQAARSRFPDLQALGVWHPALANLSPILARFRHGERKSFSFEVSHEQRIYHQMIYYVPDGSLVRVFLKEVTEQRQAREILERESTRDRVTGLPNRAQFLLRLEEQIRRAQPGEGPQFAVLSLNLDRFKVVNDSLGHAAGDELLAAVAMRLSACLTPEDTAARVGGDEFAVLSRRTPEPNGALQLAERIRGAIALPLEIARQEIFPRASVGIAPAQAAGDGEALLRDARIAMYRAKSLGGGRCEVFDGALGSRSLDRLRLENELRRATERGDLTMFYQPIIRLSDGALVAFEALMRWPRQDLGMVPPAEFIPIAEEAGLIRELTYWALAEVCGCLREWAGGGPPGSGPAIHLNLSSRVLSDPELVQRVAGALAESGLAGDRLVLEITESVLMEDPAVAAETLHQLKGLDLRLAIDDFGTGYSSLSYLQQFPIDGLKIDRSFVGRIGGRGESPEIVRAVLALAGRLSLEVIAEGVETEDQLALLARMGCNVAQGYLFSRPVDRDTARSFLAQPNRWAELCPIPAAFGTRAETPGLETVGEEAPS